MTKKLLACKQTINNLKTTVKLQQEKLIIYEKKINKENDHIKENMNNDNNNNKNKNKEKDKEKEKER